MALHKTCGNNPQKRYIGCTSLELRHATQLISSAIHCIDPVFCLILSMVISLYTILFGATINMSSARSWLAKAQGNLPYPIINEKEKSKAHYVTTSSIGSDTIYFINQHIPLLVANFSHRGCRFWRQFTDSDILVTEMT